MSWRLYGIVLYFETTLPTQISWSIIAIYHVPNAMPRQSTHCTGHSVYPVCPPAVKIRIQTDTKGRAETLVIVLLPSLSVLFSLIFQRLFVENLSADSHQTPFCSAGAISYFVLFMSRLRAVRAHPRGHQDSVLTKIRLEKGLVEHKHTS